MAQWSYGSSDKGEGGGGEGGGDKGGGGEGGGGKGGGGGGGGDGGTATTMLVTVMVVVTGSDTLATSTEARVSTPDAASDALSAEAVMGGGGDAPALVSVAVAAMMTLPALTSMLTVQSGSSHARRPMYTCLSPSFSSSP